MTEVARQIQQLIGAGKIEVPTKELVALVSSWAAKKTPDTPFLLASQSITGTAEKDHVTVHFTFKIRILDRRPVWHTIPLVSDTLTVTKYEVNNPAARFGLLSNQHSLIVRGDVTEEIQVTVSCLSKYASDKNCGVNLSVIPCTMTSVRFAVPRPDLQISVTPSIAVQHQYEQGSTTVVTSLSNTKYVNIQWTYVEARKKRRNLVWACFSELF